MKKIWTDEHAGWTIILFIYLLFGENLSYQDLKMQHGKKCNVNQALKLFCIHQELPQLFLCSAIYHFVCLNFYLILGQIYSHMKICLQPTLENISLSTVMKLYNVFPTILIYLSHLNIWMVQTTSSPRRFELIRIY